MKRRLLLTFLLLLLAAVLACTALFYLLLPSYLEQRLLPGLATRLGVEEVRGRVSRLGLSGAELVALTAGAAGNPALVIRAARLDYTIPGLLRGRLAGAQIEGLRLRLDLRDGSLSVPGLDWPQAEEDEGKGIGLQVPLGNLDIRNGELLLASGQQPFRVPFALSARQGAKKIMAELRLFPASQEFFVQAQADPATGEAAGRFRTERFAAAGLALFPMLPQEVHAGGAIDLRGTFRLDLASLALSHFAAEGAWRRAVLMHDGVVFRAATDREPLAFTANGSTDRWHLGVTDLFLVAPRPLAVPALDVEVVRTADRFEGSGRFRLRLPAAADDPVSVLEPFAVSGAFAGNYAPGGPWRFEMKADPGNEAEGARFRGSDGELAFRPRTLALSGEGQGKEGELEVEAVLADLEGKTAAATLRAPEALLTGRFEAKGAAISSGQIDLALTGLRADIGGRAAATLGRVQWRGDFGNGGEHGGLRSVFQLADSGVSYPGLNLEAKGITAEIPFAWPPPASGPQGDATIADLVWAGKSLGPVTAALRQESREYRFDAVHSDRLLDGLTAMLAGTASWREEGVALRVKLTVPPQELRAVALEGLHPAAAGLTLGGGLEATGSFTAAGGGTAGTLKAVLSRGILEHREKEWRIDGIETDFTLSDLLQLQSAPNQRLVFDRAAIGRLLFGKGGFGYQLEEPGSLLVREGEVAWSGGLLRLNALRLAPGKKEHELEIYCDGVRIADLLAQFGVTEVRGEGTVSGQIPLTIRNGDIRFGEGLLASPPGRGGFLRVKDTGRLADLIPEAARPGQIDFAMEALRNFDYSWVKLHFGSKGEELIIRMQLDGRPAEPLPFTFDRELGSFVRFKGEGKAGISQPIRLDVNFRLPLDDLLHYGAGFQGLFGK